MTPANAAHQAAPEASLRLSLVIPMPARQDGKRQVGGRNWPRAFKRCSDCKRDLPRKDFEPNNEGYDIPQPVCRLCAKVQQFADLSEAQAGALGRLGAQVQALSAEQEELFTLLEEGEKARTTLGLQLGVAENRAAIAEAHVAQLEAALQALAAQLGAPRPPKDTPKELLPIVSEWVERLHQGGHPDPLAAAREVLRACEAFLPRDAHVRQSVVRRLFEISADPKGACEDTIEPDACISPYPFRVWKASAPLKYRVHYVPNGALVTFHAVVLRKKAYLGRGRN